MRALLHAVVTLPTELIQRPRYLADAPERGLIVPAALLGQIVAHLARELPCEGCGLLAERREGSDWVACRYFPGENIDRSPTRFTMDPRAVIDALREIDARGWRLAAIVHSHPVGAPTPSPTDLREAYYPEAAFLIVGFGRGTPDARAWRFNRFGGSAVEVGMVTIDDRSAMTPEPGSAPERRRD